jgi:hypothetical protein
MTGYQSKKAAAQAKVEGPIHVVCQCDKCKAQPPQRPWVGLTDEEAQWLYDNCRTPSNLIEMVEAKLKEKNNGT